jgi:hypothetical protein
MMYDEPSRTLTGMRGGREMEPRAIERFTDAMSEEQVEPQMLSPYTLERTAGCYVKVAHVEGPLRMMVFQSRPGEKSVCVADLLFTREQFQEMARVMGMPGL